jgi:hypothetical protein
VLSNLGLGAVLKNTKLEIATGISDDGNVIVGYGMHNGLREGRVAALSGAPFPSSEPDEDDAPGPSFKFMAIAGIREHHGLLWDPTKGPRPIDPDPPPFITTDLLSFTLTPRDRAQHVEMIAFSIENAVAIVRDDWRSFELIVDRNANGAASADETGTVAGPGFADAACDRTRRDRPWGRRRHSPLRFLCEMNPAIC